jgi:hypothetical protein
LAHDVLAGGGEVAVVVVDVDQLDVVATAYPVDQPGQWLDDLGEAAASSSASSSSYEFSKSTASRAVSLMPAGPPRHVYSTHGRQPPGS